MGVEAHRLPGYRPSFDGAGKLPNRPNIPHIPHLRHAGRIATFAFAGAVALTAAEGFVKPQGTTDPIARAGEIPAEQMRHGYGQLLNITQSADGQLNFEITSHPTVLHSNEGYWVPTLQDDDGSDNKSPFDSINAIGLNEVMNGDVSLYKSDENGNPIVDAQGGRYGAEPTTVDGLIIPVVPETARA